jgi:hypothetical protein
MLCQVGILNFRRVISKKNLHWFWITFNIVAEDENHDDYS